MPELVTEAIVLHTMDYLESSVILRLATREGGVRSALARGARRSGRRYAGGSLDLFCQGAAHLYIKPGRDLDTFAAFDMPRARPRLAMELPRFLGASAIAEMAIRFGHGESDPLIFDALSDALDAIAGADAEHAAEATLSGAWRIVAALGFAPSLDACVECHDAVETDGPVRFSHPAGGALCARCGNRTGSGRLLPPSACAALRAWISAETPLPAPPMSAAETRAHQRLLREFLYQHLVENRHLRAFEVWEQDAWFPGGSSQAPAVQDGAGRGTAA